MKKLMLVRLAMISTHISRPGWKKTGFFINFTVNFPAMLENFGS